jgi:hypothetical protein
MLIYTLKDCSVKRGVDSLCLGSGEAVALTFELE